MMALIVFYGGSLHSYRGTLAGTLSQSVLRGRMAEIVEEAAVMYYVWEHSLTGTVFVGHH